jgi:hypothetical protein
MAKHPLFPENTKYYKRREQMPKLADRLLFKHQSKRLDQWHGNWQYTPYFFKPKKFKLKKKLYPALHLIHNKKKSNQKKAMGNERNKKW